MITTGYREYKNMWKGTTKYGLELRLKGIDESIENWKENIKDDKTEKKAIETLLFDLSCNELPVKHSSIKVKK